jgi:hypothetical protein
MTVVTSDSWRLVGRAPAAGFLASTNPSGGGEHDQDTRWGGAVASAGRRFLRRRVEVRSGALQRPVPRWVPVRATTLQMVAVIARRLQRDPPTPRPSPSASGRPCCSSMGLAGGSRRRRSTAPPPRRSFSDSDSSNSGAGTAGSVDSLPAVHAISRTLKREANEGGSTLPQTGMLRCAFGGSGAWIASTSSWTGDDRTTMSVRRGGAHARPANRLYTCIVSVTCVRSTERTIGHPRT